MTLWRHRATPFGAVSAVWSFNRFADSMVALTRRLGCCLLGHFVDDFTGLDMPDLGDSGFVFFRSLYQVMGLNMKKNKEQPPAPRQKVLGVLFHTHQDYIELAACPERCSKMLDLIQDTLNKNHLDQLTAQRLAGKLAFLTTTFYGNMGRAALQPIYARGHGLGEQVNNKLTFGLRAALHMLQHLVLHAKPRRIPTQLSAEQQVIIYTDAFYQPGERQLPSSAGSSLAKNGWGLVIRFPAKTLFSHGIIPDRYVQRFTSRRAYIYMLEILAVVIATAHFHDMLPRLQLYFVDNMAGRQGLLKGYGKDLNVNALISAFWTLAARYQWHPHIQYVRSHLNISDPVSRHDVTAARLRGWTEVNLDVMPMLQILENFADGGQQDLATLTSDLLSCVRHRAGWDETARCGLKDWAVHPTALSGASSEHQTNLLAEVEKEAAFQEKHTD
eukprot:Skav223831  [mRNA]  locus=scaffold1256:63584:64912:- [translate_table: standard]